jgi:hypothetical protein
VWISAKFGTCTVVSVNETLVEDKMRRFKGECAHFSFNKCPIYTHDGASAKFITNSHETDNSVGTYPLSSLVNSPDTTVHISKNSQFNLPCHSKSFFEV